MSHRMRTLMLYVAVAFAAAAPAHAHHAMDYRLPATLLEGLLSGLGHPVIGIDHLFFIIAAGVLAARLERGYVLTLLFVMASLFAAAARAAGAPWEMSEFWIAGSLVVLGGVALAVQTPARGLIAALFVVAGLLHGYALAAAIVGAERTPLYAYFAGLAVIQCGIALGAWAATRWLAAHRPEVPVQRLVGASAALAGMVFAGMIALG